MWKFRLIEPWAFHQYSFTFFRQFKIKKKKSIGVLHLRFASRDDWSGINFNTVKGKIERKKGKVVPVLN
jgi:hypothetical protein